MIVLLASLTPRISFVSVPAWVFLGAWLVEKTADPDDGRRVIYRPLPPAIDLIPVLAELVAWGSRHTAVPENPVFAAFVNPETREAAVSQVMARLTAQVR